MIDIFDITDEGQLILSDTIVSKAENLLSTQLDSLEYLPDFGIDLDYFLSTPIRFQNESFKAYLVEKMSENLINVADVREAFENLLQRLTFTVSPNENNEGMII